MLANHVNTRLLAGFLVGSLLLSVLSCGSTSEPESIREADLVGSYAVTAFTATTGADTVDLLAGGNDISLTLNADGTTSGTFFVAEGSGLSLDLTGVWAFDPNPPEVRLDHDADTFLRDMTFAAERDGGVIQLRGERTFSGTETHVVLVRS